MADPTSARITVLLLVICSFCSASYTQEVEIQSSGQIKNVKDPVDPQDVVTKAHLDNAVLSFGVTLGLPGIQGLLNAGYCPLEIIDAGAPKDSLIGIMYQGGLIFYLDDLDTVPGLKGLVAAPQDQDQSGDFTRPYGCSGVDLPIPNVVSGPSGVGAEIGDGATNTVGTNTAGCSFPGDAAELCASLSLDGYEDWFLPSAKELNEMYLRIGQGATAPHANIGGFLDEVYWSSSEVSNSNAWSQNFLVGNQINTNKLSNIRIRAARAF